MSPRTPRRAVAAGSPRTAAAPASVSPHAPAVAAAAAGAAALALAGCGDGAGERAVAAAGASAAPPRVVAVRVPSATGGPDMDATAFAGAPAAS